MIFTFNILNKGFSTQLVKMLGRIYLLVMLLTLAIQKLSGQVEISLINESINSIAEVWDIKIESSMALNQSVFFVVSILENSITSYDSRSRVFSLNNGTQYFNKTMLQPIQVNVDRINDKPLINLKLDIIIKLFNTSNELLAENRFIKSSSDIDNASTRNSKAIPKILFSGNARISGQLSNMQGYGSKLPRNYVRAEFYPNISVASIPFGLDLLLSTEQSAQRQSINQIALRFDAAKFKNIMMDRLRSRIKDIESGTDQDQLIRLSNLKSMAIEQKFPKLKEWQQQLSDPEMLKSVNKVEELNKLKTVLKNTDIQKNKNRLLQLKQSKNKLTEAEEIEIESLIQFNSEIVKLEDKVSALAKYKNFGKKHKKLVSKIKSAKQFRNNPILSDPKTIRKSLGDFNIMNKWQKILNGFENISLGNNFPYYSRLSLNGLAINGVHIQYNPGLFYIETNYGQSVREALNTSYIIPFLTLPQTTIAIKTGIGSKQGNHIHFSFIDIKDRVSKIVTTAQTPLNQNRIISSDGRVSLFEESLILGGELVGSMFTKEQALNADNSTEYVQLAAPLKFLFPRNNNSSSRFDIAYSMFAKIKLFTGNTDINLNHECIGPNYYNLGAPSLIRNLNRWKAEIRQSFWERKILFSLFAKEDNNGLNPLLNSVSSKTRYFGLNGNLNIPKWPVIVMSYAPFMQNNNLVLTGQDNNISNTSWNVLLQYPLQITNNLLANTTVQFVDQSQKSILPGTAFKYQLLGLTQAIQMKQSSVAIALTYTPEQIINNVSQKALTLEANGSVLLFKKWNNQIGLQYFELETTEKRFGYYWQMNISLLKNLNLEMKIQRNIYKNLDVSKEFMDIYGLGGIKYSW